MRYDKFLPKGRTFGWEEVGKPDVARYLMIHACWYATETLRALDLVLPTGTPYTDSLLLLHPMPYVKRLRYLDVEPYFYAIGREGQSVDVEVIKAHIDQQLAITRRAIDDVDYAALFAREPRCALLMAGYMECMMSVSTIYLFKINTPESLQKNRELWAFMKETDSTLYNNVKRTWAGLANRRTRIGRILAQAGYALAQKIFKFA